MDQAEACTLGSDQAVGAEATEGFEEDGDFVRGHNRPGVVHLDLDLSCFGASPGQVPPTTADPTGHPNRVDQQHTAGLTDDLRAGCIDAGTWVETATLLHLEGAPTAA